MKNNKLIFSNKWFVMVIFFVVLSSCKKEEEVLPNPVIEFVKVSTEEVVSFQNNVIITLSYKDPQGDIGEPDPDKNTVKVKDSRLDEADFYHIAPLTPDLVELDVQGEFTIELPALFLLGNGNQETTKLSVQIQDRAGNWSNTVISPTITIINE